VIVFAFPLAELALDAARGAEAEFDMIVTNNYMPGLSGPELIARVRQDFPTLPIPRGRRRPSPEVEERPDRRVVKSAKPSAAHGSQGATWPSILLQGMQIAGGLGPA
jgi:hypothetical protein